MEDKDRRLIGKRLGTCTLEQLLGAGGMGTVYLARQQRPSRTVAVKVLHAGGTLATEGQREFLIRFRREADVIAQLDHINILPVYEYDEQDGLAYLVMPYLTGGSLRDALARNGPLPLSQALIDIEQIAAALQYAHAHRVVHRDIKPANMLFHADGRLVLADFGIARIMREEGEHVEATLTGPSHFLGSVEYMSPEMVNGSQIDHRTDIYELGIVLFQMLAGRVPFQGTTPFMIAAQHLRELPPSLSLLAPSIPSIVDAVVYKALAKKPDDRYQSAHEMVQALHAASNSSAHTVSTETYTTHVVPPTYISPHQRASTANEYATTNETMPEIQHPDAPDRSSFREAHTYELDSDSPPYQENAFYRRPGMNEPAILPPSSPQISIDHRSRWPTWIITLCLVGALIAGGLLLGLPALRALEGSTSPNASASSTPQSTSTQTPAQQAQSIVQSYYDAINQADYQRAYQLWSSDYQSTHPYDRFASGFATTIHDTITLKATTQLASGVYRVEATLIATDKTSTGATTTIYTGNYIVGQEHGVWKLLTANFQQVS